MQKNIIVGFQKKILRDAGNNILDDRVRLTRQKKDSMPLLTHV